MFRRAQEGDFIDKLKNKAINTHIKLVWGAFIPIYECVEHHCQKNNIIISDVDLIGGDKGSYVKKYVLYCQKPYNNAVILINHIAELPQTKIDIRFIQLFTAIPHVQLNITYKNIRLVELNTINIRDNIYNLIKPIFCSARYITGDLAYMPYEIELINIYKKLYSPKYATEWANIQSIEAILFEKTINRKNKLIGGATTGHINLAAVKKKIFEDLLPKNNWILIGEWAILHKSAPAATNTMSHEKIQFIVAADIKSIFAIIYNFIAANFPYLKTTYKEQNLYLLEDYRTKRYTIYVQDKIAGKEKSIIDIFINGTYELIPWVPAARNIKIGNIYVLLRFLLIDCWILRILYWKNILPREIYTKKINKLFANCKLVRAAAKSPYLPPIDNYIGVYIDENVHFKNLIAEKRCPIYNPYYYKKNNGEYMIAQTS